MTRRLAKTVLGLTGLWIANAGCKPPDTRIAELDPYVGGRPPAVQPLRKPPSKSVKPLPSQFAGEPGWLPPGGIDRRWQHVVIHHSGSDKSTPQGMRDWHVKGRGWDELGYHFVIGNGVGYGDGKVFVGARWTRQMHGAHCKTADNHYNDHGIGICLIGDLNSRSPTPRQVQSLARLVSFLSGRCGIPRSQVLTHGGVTHKTECPGRRFSLAAVMQQLPRQPVAASSR